MSGRAELLLIFDDCYCDLLHVAPFLMARGIRAIPFAVSGQLGGTNKWNESPDTLPLRLLSASELQILESNGIEIGAHSCSHRSLRGLDPEALSAEICGSIADLERAGLRRPRFFAYPYGHYDKHAQMIVRD
jgi:peptidoglycan/xylan/chitin deacetylase (PgdA/CDA1 family)